MMNRRDAIARVGLIVGGTVVGAEVFLSGCAPGNVGSGAAVTFDAFTVALLDEIGETILPTTARSPGAKAAQIGEFMKTIVTDCYDEEDQKAFATAAPIVEAAAEEAHGKSFMDLTADERHTLILSIDQQATQYDATRGAGARHHGFSLVKQLTLWGYFTSEVGSKEALRYNPVPGREEGCIDYTPGDGAWAET